MTATWTRVADPEADAALLPARFAARMLRARAEGGGSFGLLLAGGEVLRVAALAAAHVSSGGTVLLDVVLDKPGVPDGAEAAWRAKHYLGAPVPGATLATVNLAHVAAVVEFAAAAEAERPAGEAGGVGAEATVEGLRQAAEEAAAVGRPPAA